MYMTKKIGSDIITLQLHNVGYSCVEVRMKREHGENPSVQLTLLYLANRSEKKSLDASLGRHGTVFEALSQETCYIYRGSSDLVKGSFALHRTTKSAVRNPFMARWFCLVCVKKIPDRDFLFFVHKGLKKFCLPARNVICKKRKPVDNSCN